MPFYNVYGGTQDNYTPRRPVADRTATTASATPTGSSPRAATASSRRSTPRTRTSSTPSRSTAASCRYDRKTGEQVDIQPQPGKGEPALRWNWDSPLIISPHSHTRLYFAANRLFRSDDRGDTWTAGQPRPHPADRPQQAQGHGQGLGRRRGGLQHLDLVLRQHRGARPSRPRRRGCIYVGTDDGLIQVTEDGGANWRKVDKFPGVPDDTYVSDLEASPHDADVVYAAFNNHKNGDFKPYLLKSTDRGQDLDVDRRRPARARHRAGRVAEDHVDPQPALRRHRVRPVLHARRRQEVDPAQEPADDPGARPRASRSGRTTSWSPPSAAASTSSTTTRRCGTVKAETLEQEATLFPR